MEGMEPVCETVTGHFTYETLCLLDILPTPTPIGFHIVYAMCSKNGIKAIDTAAMNMNSGMSILTATVDVGELSSRRSVQDVDELSSRQSVDDPVKCVYQYVTLSWLGLRHDVFSSAGERHCKLGRWVTDYVEWLMQDYMAQRHHSSRQCFHRMIPMMTHPHHPQLWTRPLE